MLKYYITINNKRYTRNLKFKPIYYIGIIIFMLCLTFLSIAIFNELFGINSCQYITTSFNNL